MSASLRTSPLPLLSEPFVYRHIGPSGREGTLQISPLFDSPALRSGYELLHERPAIVLGMSPGNGYFTRKRVEIAICGMAHMFGNVTVVLPDTITSHTYRALGYSEETSRARARTHGRRLRSYNMRAFERARAAWPKARLRLLDWDRDVASRRDFDAAYARIATLFASDRRFRDDTLAAVRAVLARRSGRMSVEEAALCEGAEYLLKELACISVCRDALGRDVVMPYFQRFAVGCTFCEGGYGPRVPGVGWVVYDIELSGERGSGSERERGDEPVE